MAQQRTEPRTTPNIANSAESFLYDGSTIFVAGQDTSKVPAQVSSSGYFASVNTQVSFGVPRPRWGLDKKKLTFPSGGIKIPISNVIVPYAEIFEVGRFQAAFPYSIGPDSYIVIVISGTIFLVNQVSWVVTVMPIQDGSTLNENTPRLNWSSAGNFNVIFDYPNFPVILDGITARRADPTKFEVPVSVGGAYNQNRLFIYNAGNDYTAGDPTGSLAAPEAPVTFLEVEQAASPYFGQIFSLPTGKLEPITAMAFLQLTDTSTGIGPLLIGTENSIYSVQAQLPRVQWDSSTFASAFVLNAGIAGPRSWVNVNSDVFFVSPDGQLRTANMSRNEQGQWARVPISREVQNWIKAIDPSLIKYSTIAYFNNKILISVNPYRTGAVNTQRQSVFDFAFGGFVVLSLDNVAILGHAGTPAWDGLWTGVRPMDFVVNNKRLFVISKDEEFRNEIYEFDPAQTYDTSGSDIRYIKSTHYSREFSFQSPFQDKDLHSIDFDLRDVKGDFKLDAFYKPSQGSQYVSWQTFEHCAPWRDCAFPMADEINGLAGHSFMGLTLGSPISDACDPVTQSRYDTFRSVQVKLTLEGANWSLHGYRLKSIYRPQDQQINLSCDPKACVKVAAECNSSDWEIGPFKSCLTQQT